MGTRERPRNEWRTFFDAFSRQHEGWLTTIEVTGGDIGDQFEATGLPLEGISADPKGSEPDAIEITVGRDPADQVTRIVENASRVMFEERADGEHTGLEIESTDGERTIVQFRIAQAPKLLDNETATRRRKAGGGGAQ